MKEDLMTTVRRAMGETAEDGAAAAGRRAVENALAPPMLAELQGALDIEIDHAAAVLFNVMCARAQLNGELPALTEWPDAPDAAAGQLAGLDHQIGALRQRLAEIDDVNTHIRQLLGW
jgi:hypothetical protein